MLGACAMSKCARTTILCLLPYTWMELLILKAARSATSAEKNAALQPAMVCPSQTMISRVVRIIVLHINAGQSSHLSCCSCCWLLIAATAAAPVEKRAAAGVTLPAEGLCLQTNGASAPLHMHSWTCRELVLNLHTGCTQDTRVVAARILSESA